MSFSIHAEVDKLRVMLTPGDKAVSRSVRSQRKECKKKRSNFEVDIGLHAPPDNLWSWFLVSMIDLNKSKEP